jgi:hypothetical protein
MQQAGAKAQDVSTKNVGEDGRATAGSQGPGGGGASGGGSETAPNSIDAQLRRKRLTLAARSARFIGWRK